MNKSTFHKLICLMLIISLLFSCTTVSFAATKKPSKPKEVEAISLNYNKIQVTWEKSARATGYYLYIYQSGKLLGKAKVKQNGVKITSQKNLKITAGKTYTVKVKAYNRAGNSSFSSAKKVKPIPNKPSITVKYNFNGKNKVSWKKLSGVSGYSVYRSTKKSSGYKLVKTLKDDDKISFTDANVSKKKTYYYKVKAYKTVNGKKVYGKYSTVKSDFTGVGNVSNVKTLTYDENQVKISWDKSNATGVSILTSIMFDNQVYDGFDSVDSTKSTWTMAPVYMEAFSDTGMVKIKIKPYRTYNGKKYYGTAKTYYHKFTNDVCGVVSDVKITKIDRNIVRLTWNQDEKIDYVMISHYANGKLIDEWKHDSSTPRVAIGSLADGVHYFKVKPIRYKDGFPYENDVIKSNSITVMPKEPEKPKEPEDSKEPEIIEEDPGLVSESEYLSKYTDTSKYSAIPYYRYATRTKEYKKSGYSSLSSDNGNPWNMYDTQTSTSTSGYYFKSVYPSGSTSYTDTSKVTKSIVSKGKYYYAYSLKRNGDKAYFIDSTRANVISWAKKNFSVSSVWAEDNLYYLWYVGGENSDRTVTLKKSVKSYTGSTVSPGTSSCMKTDGTATLGGTQKLYYYSRCYKVKTTTVTNYFERWSSWSSWGEWTTKESTDEYKKEDTTKMYYVVCN